MNKLVAVSLGLLCMVGSVKASDTISGKAKSACEATLCLAASGGTPGECMPSLKEYFSIEVFDDGEYDPRETLKKRKNFLELCPSDDEATTNRVNTSKQAIKRCRGRVVCPDEGRLLVERL